MSQSKKFLLSLVSVVSLAVLSCFVYTHWESLNAFWYERELRKNPKLVIEASASPGSSYKRVAMRRYLNTAQGYESAMRVLWRELRFLLHPVPSSGARYQWFQDILKETSVFLWCPEADQKPLVTVLAIPKARGQRIKKGSFPTGDLYSLAAALLESQPYHLARNPDLSWNAEIKGKPLSIGACIRALGVNLENVSREFTSEVDYSSPALVVPNGG